MKETNDDNERRKKNNANERKTQNRRSMTMKCWRRTMNMKEMNNDHNEEEQKIEKLRTMKSNDNRGEEQPWRKSEKKNAATTTSATT